MAQVPSESKRKTRKATQNKVRVKLPSIESYSKTLEFPCEAPGRVVVRLERLMGSDKVKPTDPKFLSTFGERLEEDESVTWGSRSRFRKKIERNRSRQLAIDGLMEPAEDMQDLYNHPIFRVNRVLNRLADFDTNMVVGNVGKLPPLTAVEPFEDDQTGGIFKSYPTHKIFEKSSSGKKSASPGFSPSRSTSRVYLPEEDNDDARPKTRRSSKKSVLSSHSHHDIDESHSGSPRKAADRSTSQMSASVVYKKSDTSVSQPPSRVQSGTRADRWRKAKKRYVRRKSNASPREDSEFSLSQEVDSAEYLKRVMHDYGVPSEENLAQDWKAYRSMLVDAVYENTGGSSEDLYELARQVIGLYDRQLDVVDHYVDQITETPAVVTSPIDDGVPQPPPPPNTQKTDTGNASFFSDSMFDDEYYNRRESQDGLEIEDNPPELEGTSSSVWFSQSMVNEE